MLGVSLLSYFWPHPKNNHRPKILHPQTLFAMSLLMGFWQIMVLFLIPHTHVKILGYASNIPVEDVIRISNEKRVASGLAPLSYNSELSAAAEQKAEHMLANDYWAHASPDGTEPWLFFKNVGYKYRYAGENLARDFSNASSAVDAWMASPTHKDNLLSEKYQDIGIAVVEGDLDGVDTTLIVQLFGTKMSVAPQIAPVAEAKETLQSVAEEPMVKTEMSDETIKEEIVPVETPLEEFAGTQITEAREAGASSTQILISPFTTTKNISLITITLLLLVLAIDAIVISKSRIARISGRNLAHILFIGMIMTIIIILKAGKIV